MTIGLYHKRTLYADRAGIVLTKPLYFNEIKKIYISECGCLAMVIAGDPYKDDAFYHDNMAALVEAMRTADSLDASKVLDSSFNVFFKAREALFMTARNAYFLSSPVDGKCNANIIDMNESAAIGSSANYVMIGILAGKDPLEAIRIGSTSDACSHLSDVDSISMDDLKPFM